MDDYYQILNLQPNATQDEIARRYRFLVKAYHPDRFSTDEEKKAATEEMQRINAAFSVLSDPCKRADYDRSKPSGAANKKSKETSPHEPEPNSASQAFIYLEGLLDKWQHLITNFSPGLMIAKLHGKIFETTDKFFNWAEPYATSAQSQEYRDSINIFLNLFTAFNLALGAEEVASGLPISIPREELLREAREPFELEIARLGYQAIKTGRVHESQVKPLIYATWVIIRQLQTSYIEIGKRSVTRASTAQSSHTSAPPKSNASSQPPPSSNTYSQPTPPRTTSTPAADASANVEMGFCSSCGAHTYIRDLAFHRNTGFLIFRRYRKVEGPICADCIEKYFWAFTVHTLFFGWWGAISLIVTPLLILTNIVNYLRGWPLRKHARDLRNTAVGWKTSLILLGVIISVLAYIEFGGVTNRRSSSLSLDPAYAAISSTITPAHAPSSSLAQKPAATRTSRPTQRVTPTRRPNIRLTLTQKPKRIQVRQTLPPLLTKEAPLTPYCTLWNNVTKRNEGVYMCVYGYLKSAYGGDGLFYMTFSDDEDAFRFVVTNYYYYEVRSGDCVLSEGKIELHNDMPYMNVKELFDCGS